MGNPQNEATAQNPSIKKILKKLFLTSAATRLSWKLLTQALGLIGVNLHQTHWIYTGTLLNNHRKSQRRTKGIAQMQHDQMNY